MDGDGLIESMEPVIPLADFRRLPGYMKVRLTQKGRTFINQGRPPRHLGSPHSA
jgi:hypothetical protein